MHVRLHKRNYRGSGRTWRFVLTGRFVPSSVSFLFRHRANSLGDDGLRKLTLRGGQTRFQPALPTAVHRFHVVVAHFLEILGH
jgi:hypothetical protein